MNERETVLETFRKEMEKQSLNSGYTPWVNTVTSTKSPRLKETRIEESLRRELASLESALADRDAENKKLKALLRKTLKELGGKYAAGLDASDINIDEEVSIEGIGRETIGTGTILYSETAKVMYVTDANGNRIPIISTTNTQPSVVIKKDRP